MRPSAGVAGSQLLIDEYFRSEDDRFVDELVESTASKRLYDFAAKWIADVRPWARAMMQRYIDDGCDRVGHRGLVRQLFTHAEEGGDDELMAHFAVAFDRLVQRRVRTWRRWDWQAREQVEEQKLVRATKLPVRQSRDEDKRFAQFSIYTRLYLQRRALRYFRRIGFRDSMRFGKAARRVLALYRDEHLQTAEQLLDAWSLLHFCHRGSSAIRRTPRGIWLADGASIADLAPAPLHPDAQRGVRDELFALLHDAQSLFVRRWTVAWLRAEYARDLERVELRALRPLLRSPHEDVQTFAAELLGAAIGLEKLAVADWLELLDIDNAIAIPLICELVVKLVTPDRLDLAQCVTLARARPAPVAELGLRWAQQKPVETREALEVVLAIADAPCDVVRAAAAPWLGGLVAKLGTAFDVRELIDAGYPEIRAAGLALLDEPRFGDALLLWAAATESPYPDVRVYLVRHLASRVAKLPDGSVRRVWASVLLDVQRGNRDKRLALKQVAARAVEQIDRADELVPLLAIVLRSVRPAERRAALAAVAGAAQQERRLRAAIARHVPELTLPADDGAEVHA